MLSWTEYNKGIVLCTCVHKYQLLLHNQLPIIYITFPLATLSIAEPEGKDRENPAPIARVLACFIPCQEAELDAAGKVRLSGLGPPHHSHHLFRYTVGNRILNYL